MTAEGRYGGGGGALPLKRGGTYGDAGCAPLPPRVECRYPCVLTLTVEAGYGIGACGPLLTVEGEFWPGAKPIQLSESLSHLFKATITHHAGPMLCALWVKYSTQKSQYAGLRVDPS